MNPHYSGVLFLNWTHLHPVSQMYLFVCVFIDPIQQNYGEMPVLLSCYSCPWHQSFSEIFNHNCHNCICPYMCSLVPLDKNLNWSPFCYLHRHLFNIKAFWKFPGVMHYSESKRNSLSTKRAMFNQTVINVWNQCLFPLTLQWVVFNGLLICHGSLCKNVKDVYFTMVC